MAEAGGYSSDLTPSLGTSMCHTEALKRQKKYIYIFSFSKYCKLCLLVVLICISLTNTDTEKEFFMHSRYEIFLRWSMDTGGSSKSKLFSKYNRTITCLVECVLTFALTVKKTNKQKTKGG